MPLEIVIPRLGWSMEEGNFMGWLKKAGEAVKSGEPLFTLESEKAAQDIEATDSGILRIPRDGPKAGDVVKVGHVIGHLLTEPETSASEASFAKESPTGQELARESKTETELKTASSLSFALDKGKPKTAKSPAISPRARHRALVLGVNTSCIQGSGRAGRIVEADVLKRASTKTSSGVSTMRRMIAQRTSASFASTPHFYLRCEIDATALIRLREKLLPEVESAAGVRLTLTDLIIRAQALALRTFPVANAIWMDNNTITLPTCDVGLVVGLPDGLMIPIVRSPDNSNLVSVTKQRSELVASVRAGKLTHDALQGGATALSNLGNTRVDEFSAVIAPHQSSMLAVGRAVPRPYLLNGALTVRTTMRLCLSVDHRVLDGGPAAEYLGLIVQLLEAPDKLI
jgi:pyruvate dehydrogenase E2 component (dihydrolipoamide acetyltransferase)